MIPFKRVWLSNIDLFFVVDEIDYEWVMQWSWNYKIRRSVLMGDHYYVKRNAGVARTPVYLHREICRRAHGEPPPGRPLSDHVKGNTLDLRRAAVRWFSHKENRLNRGGKTFLIEEEPEPLAIPF